MSALVLLSALVFTPAVFAAISARARSDEAARHAAIAGATLTLALSLIPLALVSARGLPVEGASPALPLVGARLRLGLDGYSAVLPPVLAMIQLAVLVGGRRAALDRRTVASVLITGSAILAVTSALDLLVLGVAWVAALLPGERLLARRASDDPLLRRTYRIFLFGGTAPILLVIAALAIHATLQGSPLPYDLQELARIGVPSAWQPLLFGLLGIAVLMRMAAVPFHGWLPVLLARGPLGVAVLLAQVQVGVCVLVRVAVPLLPEGCAAGMPVIAALGLLSTLHGAVLALVQTDLRRMIGYIVASQKGMVLLGIASMNAQSVSGALLQGVATAISITGLALVIWAVESRTGTADTTQLGGLVAKMPRTAAFFLLLGGAAIGFPGALTFISEDLLIHGILHVHPVLAVLMLVATALNAITVFRAFQRTFLGPAPRGRYAGVQALVLRERAVLLGLLSLTVLLGVAPSRLLALRETTVEQTIETILGEHAAGKTAKVDATVHVPVRRRWR